MSQENLAKLECSVCRRVTHHTTRNKRIKTRLSLKKYCKFCKKNTDHKETK